MRNGRHSERSGCPEGAGTLAAPLRRAAVELFCLAPQYVRYGNGPELRSDACHKRPLTGL